MSDPMKWERFVINGVHVTMVHLKDHIEDMNLIRDETARLARKVIAAEKLAEALRHMTAQFQHPDQMADEALAAWEAAQ